MDADVVRRPNEEAGIMRSQPEPSERCTYVLGVKGPEPRFTTTNMTFFNFTESEIRTLCGHLRSGQFTITREHKQTEVLDLTTPKETQ
jgi:hypothetical protein